MSRMTYIVAVAFALCAVTAEAESNYTYLPSNQSITSIPFTATYCAGQFDDLLGPTTKGFDASLSSSCLSSILENCNSYVEAHPVTTYYPDIASPCCGNNCDIWAMTARVLYWPTPAVRPNVTSYVDGNGFTFISPSPYVIFANMTAENACGYQGSFIEATTVAFRPNELSTWANGEYNSSIQALNYADFNGCPQTYNSDSPTSCLPYLAFGTKLASTFQPAWSTCSFRDSYLPDPPYALIPATNLLPMPTGVDTVVTSTPASSASYIQPLPIETQSSTITAMDLSTQSTLIAATASSLLQESDPPFSSIDPFLSDLSETTTESDTTYPQAVAATATTEISISTIESNVVITGQTFTPGAIATILGTLYSIPQDPSTSQQPAQVTIAGVVYTADPQSNFLIGTQTYAPGATATISGTPVSIPPLPTSPIQPAKITVAGTVYTANSNSDFVIGTQTFSPGDTATIAGTPIQIPSLSPTDNPAPSSAMIITISGTRLTLAPTATASAPPDPKVFTFAGNTYTANSLSDFVIGTQILAPGGVITVSGTPISLGAASQTDVVVGTSTQILGSLILGMFNTPAPSGTGAGGLNGSSLFTGEAAREGIGAEGSGRRKALTVMGASVVWAWVLACS